MALWGDIRASLAALLPMREEERYEEAIEEPEEEKELQDQQLHPEAETAQSQSSIDYSEAHQRRMLDTLDTFDQTHAGRLLFQVSAHINVGVIPCLLKFSGKDKDWQSWKFNTLGIFTILSINREVEWCSETDEDNLLFEFIDEKQKLIAKALWYLLRGVLQGQSTTIMLQLAEDYNGFLAWRDLLKKYEPAQSGRIHQMLMSLLHPESWSTSTFEEDLKNFGESDN